MSHQKDPLLQLLNSSGFPFQLRLEDEVAKIRSNHGWSVVAREHHWSHPVSDIDGYIDLIIGYGIIRFVIECKKAAESCWMFLAPEPQTAEVSRVRSLCTDWITGAPDVFLWSDLIASPPSFEAAFCLVRGQNEKDQPLIEKYADTLLTSVEALAREEISLEVRRMVTEQRIYVPVIVTAADLQVCRFDPALVDINTGRLPSADFTAVPFVRFRKGLARNSLAVSTAQNIAEANKEKERTLIIVQAGHLSDLLASWEMRPDWKGWPHEIGRSRVGYPAV